MLNFIKNINLNIDNILMQDYFNVVSAYWVSDKHRSLPFLLKLIDPSTRAGTGGWSCLKMTCLVHHPFFLASRRPYGLSRKSNNGQGDRYP
jgi:hypothetical protein